MEGVGDAAGERGLQLQDEADQLERSLRKVELPYQAQTHFM